MNTSEDRNKYGILQFKVFVNSLQSKCLTSGLVISSNHGGKNLLASQVSRQNRGKAEIYSLLLGD